MLAVLPYPAIDPIAFSLGPLDIRWYSLAYIIGLLLAWYLCRRMAVKHSQFVLSESFDDLVGYAAIGVILGGRLGYVLFYNLGDYIESPWEILRVWEGGMSFHGGLIGVICAVIFFAKRRRIPLLELSDMVCVVAPIGLFLGRVANFVNAELYGRVSDVPWAFVFPTSEDGLPRHPSQLYEAALEGLLLGFILFALYKQPNLRLRFGTLTGVFFLGYGLSRFIVEFFREPDSQLGYFLDWITMGQILSLPLIIAGILFIWFAPRFKWTQTHS